MPNTTRARAAGGDRSPGPIDSNVVGSPALVFANTKSLLFDGTGDFIESTQNGGFDLNFEDFGLTVTNQITIAFWHKESNSSRGSFDGLYAMTSASSWTDGFGAYWAGNTLTMWWQTFNGVNTVTSAQTGAFINAWHHYAYVYDGDLGSARAKVYVDGVEDASAAGSDLSLTGGDNVIEIGQAITNFDIQGNIDEFAIWNTPLTASNISQLFNGGDNADSESRAAAVEGANLMVWYRMGDNGDALGDEGILDNSGNGNDATARGNTSIATDVV